MKKIFFFILPVIAMAACNPPPNKKQNTGVENAAYLQKGNSIVKNTFDSLRNVLLKTISEKGHADALAFCNVQALPITAAYASEGITISRVSDKNRNPINGLKDFDKKQWTAYINLAATKDSLPAVAISHENDIHYYKPILMQPMCLSCHGSIEKDIAKNLLPVIDSLYPADKAKGYKAGELRGMWHIVFYRKK